MINLQNKKLFYLIRAGSEASQEWKLFQMIKYSRVCRNKLKFTFWQMWGGSWDGNTHLMMAEHGSIRPYLVATNNSMLGAETAKQIIET